MKKKELVWNAFYLDFSTKEPKVFNVIRDDLIDDIKKAKRKGKIHTKEDLMDVVRTNLMWHYWSKCEYEYVISDLFGKGEGFKKDVWFQIEMNLDRLVDYLWNNLM